jgi:hypothetical protein
LFRAVARSSREYDSITLSPGSRKFCFEPSSMTTSFLETFLRETRGPAHGSRELGARGAGLEARGDKVDSQDILQGVKPGIA